MQAMVNQNPAPPTMSSLRVAEELEAWPERFAIRLASALGTRQIPGGDSALRGRRPAQSFNGQHLMAGR